MKILNESSEKKKIKQTHTKALLKMGQKISYRFIDEGLTIPEYFWTTVKT